MMKDVSRIGCRSEKYLIIDTYSLSYAAEDQLYLIELGWKGQAHDARLLTTLDLLLPFFREGTDLKKGMMMLKPRLY